MKRSHLRGTNSNSAPVTMSGRGRSYATRRNELSHGDVDRETAA